MRAPTIIGLTACLALLATSASAATVNANLTVLATVVDSCGVTDATLSFGTVSPTNGTLLPASGSVNVTCSLGTAFSVGLGDGLSAASGARRMRKAATSDYLSYQLYKDALGVSRFGDATTSERAGGLLGLGLVATPVAVFGSVPSGQAAPSGAYTDTVQITVYY